MIRSMVYVACNRCGDPAGGNESFADTATEARAIAKRNGFHRLRVGGKLEDRCPKCVITMRQCAGCARSGGELTENGCPSCGPDTQVVSVIEPKTIGVCQCSSFPMAGGEVDCPNHVPGAVPL
jgi:hypothetical protein